MSIARNDRWWLEPLVALTLAIGAWLLFTAYNDFPAYYYPDQVSKALQIEHRSFNFFHPPLLLTATWAFADLGGGEYETLWQTGRNTAAFFGSMAVLFAFAAGRRLAGLTGGVIAGILTTTAPLLVTHAHLFKEDAGLAMGTMAVAWAVGLERERRDLKSAAVLGLATALCLSGKYLGVVAVPIALWALLVPPSPSRRRWLAALTFIGTTATAVLGWNFPLLTQQTHLQSGLAYEIVHVLTSHKGLVPAAPLGLLWTYLSAHTTALVLLAAIAALALRYCRRAERRFPWELPALAIAFFIPLTQSSIITPRYVLPVSLCLHLLAAVGVAELIGRLPRPSQSRRSTGLFAGGTVAIGALLIWNAVAAFGVLDAIQKDSRDKLRTWVAGELPPGARMVQFQELGLPERIEPAGGGAQILAFRWIPHHGAPNLDRIRRAGIRNIAVSDIGYERYFSGDFQLVTNPEEAKLALELKSFYEELFARGQLVWEAGPPEPNHTPFDPVVRVYQLD